VIAFSRNLTSANESKLVWRAESARCLKKSVASVKKLSAGSAALALVCVLTGTPISAATVAAPASKPVPAQWSAHNVIVKLDNLPKRYSCDDLWYKFHDVLLVLGARPDMRILAYRCEKSLTPEQARAPRVELSFYLPQALPGSQRQWSNVTAVQRIVELQPGQPRKIDAEDCELLHQIKAGLLPLIPVKVRDYRLACAAPSEGKPPFELTVTALEPVKAPATTVATR
jgi:hypothetical protein